MTYPVKFRLHALSVRQRDNLTFQQVSGRFNVGVASVVRWSKEPNPQEGGNRPATKIDMEALERDVKATPDAFHHERAARFNVSARGIGVALKRLGVTFKKSDAPSKGGRHKASVISGPDQSP